jgi:hypothetical protein
MRNLRAFLPDDHQLTPQEVRWLQEAAEDLAPTIRPGVSYSGNNTWQARNVWIVEDAAGRSVAGTPNETKTQTLCRYWRIICDEFIGHTQAQKRAERQKKLDNALLTAGTSTPLERGTCDRCGTETKHDIYQCGPATLCGECRYWLRHGRRPPRSPRCAPTSGPTDERDEFRGSHTVGRFRHTEIYSMTHYKTLAAIEGFDPRATG